MLKTHEYFIKITTRITSLKQMIQILIKLNFENVFRNIFKKKLGKCTFFFFFLFTFIAITLLIKEIQKYLIKLNYRESEKLNRNP